MKKKCELSHKRTGRTHSGSMRVTAWATAAPIVTYCRIQQRYDLPMFYAEHIVAQDHHGEGDKVHRARAGSVAKLPFGGKIRKWGIGKSMVCELQLSCFR